MWCFLPQTFVDLEFMGYVGSQTSLGDHVKAAYHARSQPVWSILETKG